MTLPAHRRGDERGTLASSSAAVGAAAVVLAAAFYYVASGGPSPSGGSSAAPSPTTSASLSTAPTETLSGTPTPTTTAATTPTDTPSPSVNRARVQVAVLNASHVSGLAGRTAKRLEKLGWAVHRVDNWSGPLPKSTVFFTPGTKRAALLLADDLGLHRVKPATSAMPSRGVTVILTGELR